MRYGKASSQAAIKEFFVMVNDNRITTHPILEVPELDEISFYWNGTKLKASRGEMISSALIANGVSVFGHHHKDGGAQGIFCANGQCAKCSVVANGVPVKSCMTAVSEYMIVQGWKGFPPFRKTTSHVALNRSNMWKQKF
jgi:sarcosine oxidase subunit alpha